MNLLLLLFLAVGVGGLFGNLLLGPAALVSAMVVALDWHVLLGHPISDLWLSLWALTALCSAAGASRLRDIGQLRPFAAPLIATCAIMSPYLLHGIAGFSGSWFWDGFAYIAGAEHLWSHPRELSAIPTEYFDYFAYSSAAASRFTSSAMIAAMRGIFGADTQQAANYYLFLCVFTFASSCAYLARVSFPKSPLFSDIFTMTITFSGIVLNLLWANNFDNLLALALNPALLGLAISASFEWLSSAMVGLIAAAILFAYPEMSPLLLLPTALTLFARCWREGMGPLRLSFWSLVACGSFAAIWLPTMTRIFFGQLAATATLSPRPGEGYFPTFFDACFPAALTGAVAPLQPCDTWLRGIPGIILAVLLALAFVKRRGIVLAATSVLGLAGALYYLLAKHYDYAAFKIITATAVPMALLVAVAIYDAGRSARIAGIALLAGLLITAALQVRAFDAMSPLPKMSELAELREHVPTGTIEIRIENQFLFEWALYYLRDRKLGISRGSLVYIPAPKDAANAAMISQSSSLLTDAPVSDQPLLWSNGRYYVYRKPITFSPASVPAHTFP